MGRIEIELGPGRPSDEARDRMSPCVRHRELFAARAAAARLRRRWPTAILADLGDRAGRESFRVSARRADKRFPLTSPQIEREVGGLIKQAKGWRVDLDHAELTIHLEMLPDHAFYFFGKEPGAGGLPTGTGGRLACLLSGGIDSPVAAYRMMRRGCSVLFIHFHSYPILSRASQEKVREIAALLTRYQQQSRLVLVPFGELQQQVVLGGSAATARGDLPAADAAHRGAAGADVARARARHRRGRRPGRVADARKPDGHRRGDVRSRSCGRWSAWTRTRSPTEAGASARCRSPTFRTRTAARCSRRAIRPRGPGCDAGRCKPSRRCRSTRWSPAPLRAPR